MTLEQPMTQVRRTNRNTASSALLTTFNIIFPRPMRFWGFMTLVLLYALGVLWIDDHYFPKKEFLEADNIMATTSIVIGLLLAFRTNSAYDRWWEGRKLWGQLVNELRNLSMTIQSLVIVDAAEKQKARLLLIAFPYTLMDHLRGKKTNLSEFGLPANTAPNAHLPLYISNLIFAMFAHWIQIQGVSGFLQIIFDTHLRSLMDICGACERIQKSPIAPSYKNIIWVWLVTYLLIVPWLLVPLLEAWAVVVMLIGAYFILALEMLAEEVEDPFGVCVNDLPLDSICRTIEASVDQVMASPKE
jgi:putative membrane protein